MKRDDGPAEESALHTCPLQRNGDVIARTASDNGDLLSSLTHLQVGMLSVQWMFKIPRRLQCILSSYIVELQFIVPSDGCTTFDI